jgi:hypothetical protein
MPSCNVKRAAIASSVAKRDQVELAHVRKNSLKPRPSLSNCSVTPGRRDESLTFPCSMSVRLASLIYVVSRYDPHCRPTSRHNSFAVMIGMSTFSRPIESSLLRLRLTLPGKA